MSMPTILLVDDEADILEATQFRLELEGYEVITAADGLAGFDAYLEHRPALVVLDVMMPGENGYRVARQIREQEETGGPSLRTPILLLTARDLSDDPERENMFMQFSGADQVIYKPFDLDELVRTVGEILS
jgi:DNA-binding response OmpR family regulator